MPANLDLLLKEYEQINSHLRSNVRQFVNWFSFFLTFSFTALAVFVSGAGGWPELRGIGLTHAVLTVFLLLHMLAFVAIIVFRRYIGAADERVQRVVAEIGEPGASPIPVRFCQWMTDLMAAGFIISYFSWFALLFVR